MFLDTTTTSRLIRSAAVKLSNGLLVPGMVRLARPRTKFAPRRLGGNSPPAGGKRPVWRSGQLCRNAGTFFLEGSLLTRESVNDSPRPRASSEFPAGDHFAARVGGQAAVDLG